MLDKTLMCDSETGIYKFDNLLPFLLAKDHGHMQLLGILHICDIQHILGRNATYFRREKLDLRGLFDCLIYWKLLCMLQSAKNL